MSAAAAAEVRWNYTTPARRGWSMGVVNILPGCQVLPVLDLIGVADGTK
jgi:hypothetical protein